MSKVRKSELPELVKAIIETVEKHDPAALEITRMYNILLELKPLIEVLAVKYDRIPLSANLKEQRMLRDRMLSVLNLQIAAITKANEVANNPEAALVIPFLNQYLKSIRTENSIVRSGRVNQMLDGLDGNQELNQALTDLHMNSNIDLLRGNQEKVNKSEADRRNALSIRPTLLNSDAEKQVKTAIDNLLNAIELAKVENANLNYQPLINELNVILSTHSSVIKARMTRLKNSSSVKTTTVALSSTTEATVV